MARCVISGGAFCSRPSCSCESARPARVLSVAALGLNHREGRVHPDLVRPARVALGGLSETHAHPTSACPGELCRRGWTAEGRHGAMGLGVGSATSVSDGPPCPRSPAGRSPPSGSGNHGRSGLRRRCGGCQLRMIHMGVRYQLPKPHFAGMKNKRVECACFGKYIDRPTTM